MIHWLTGVVNTPVAEALGWAIVHSLWQGLLVAALLAAVLPLLRDARWRYVAACGALLLLLPGIFVGTLAQLLAVDSGAGEGLRRALPVPLMATDESLWVGAAAGDLSLLVPWLAPLWIVGVVIASALQAAAWFGLFRLQRRGVCSPPDCWVDRLAALRARLGVSRPVRLLESMAVDSPVVLGHLRPLILVPVGIWERLPLGQIEAILVHELAHIRRCDYLVNGLQRVVEGLFFYHPAVWWMSHRIRTEREHCCDDLVVATRGDAQEYAAALAALEQARWSGGAMAAPVRATGGNLVNRIARILRMDAREEKRQGGWRSLSAVLALLFLVSAVAVPAWQQQQQPQQQPAGPTNYQNWLNQDVVYIIADEERAAFERLTTDAEREQFLRQFWDRRDPSPGTKVNEFQVEHYRRIAYANDRFRTRTGRSGWQTDRGRFYIVYGPPDEIEAHPSGSARTRYPHEMWLYRHIDGLGDNLLLRFVDLTGFGDYRLAPSPR